MRERRHSRGQTGIDFLIGVTVFLVVTGAVFGIAGEMVDPFAGDESTPLSANRVAARVATGILASGGHPGTLDESCTYAFFDGTTEAGCPTDGSQPVTTQVGADADTGINVTVRGDLDGDGGSSVLCHTASAVTDCSGSGTRLATGPTPAEGPIVSSRRAVRLDDRDLLLVVRVW